MDWMIVMMSVVVMRRSGSVCGPRVVLGHGLAKVRLVVGARILLVAARGQPGRPVAAMAKEGHEHEAPRIERGEGDADRHTKEREARAVAMRCEGGLNDGVLRDIASKPDRCEWYADAGQRQRADHHHPEGEGD